MVDKNTIKNNLNPRLKEIDTIVDTMIPVAPRFVRLVRDRI